MGLGSATVGPSRRFSYNFRVLEQVKYFSAVKLNPAFGASQRVSFETQYGANEIKGLEVS